MDFIKWKTRKAISIAYHVIFGLAAMQMVMCVLSACFTSIVTEIKLAQHWNEGMMSGMHEATISCLNTDTEPSRSLLRLLRGLGTRNCMTAADA